MIRPVGLDHVALNVRDLDRSVKFYTEVLGLKVTDREHNKPGIEYFLDCGDSLIGLIQGEPAGPVHAFQDGGLGANHFSLRVRKEDFDGVVKELSARGVEVAFHKKRERSWSVYFYDPDRNKVEITAWPLEDK